MMLNESRLYLRMILTKFEDWVDIVSTYRHRRISLSALKSRSIDDCAPSSAGLVNVYSCSDESLAEYERTHARPGLVGGQLLPTFPTKFPNFHRQPGFTIEVIDRPATQGYGTYIHSIIIFPQNRVCPSTSCSHTRTR